MPFYLRLPHSLQSERNNLKMQQIQHVQCPALLRLYFPPQADTSQAGVLCNIIQSQCWQRGNVTRSGMHNHLKSSRHCLHKQSTCSRRSFLCTHFQANFSWCFLPNPFSVPFSAWSGYQHLQVSKSLVSYQHLLMQCFSTKWFTFPSSFPCYFLGWWHEPVLRESPIT